MRSAPESLQISPRVISSRTTTEYFISLLTQGQSAERVGFFPFKEKLQATALVRMLGLRDVAQVNDVLNTMINKPVRVEYCPGKDNTMVVCGFES